MVGGPTAGFDVNVDWATGLVVLDARGFWDTETASACEVELRTVLEHVRSSSWKLLLDFTGFSPQKPEVQQILMNVLRAIQRGNPGRVAAAADNAVTMLQLKRLWNDCGAGPCCFVASVSAAQVALGN